MSERSGFHLVRAARYEPVPAGAEIIVRRGQRFARLERGGKSVEVRLVRATKGRHAGEELAVFESASYMACFCDHRAIRRRLAAGRVRRAAMDLGRQIVKLVADVQANGRLSDASLRLWVATLPQSTKERLARWQLLDGTHVAASASLAGLLDGWAAALRAKGTSERQCRQQRTRAAKLLDFCGVSRVTDLRRGTVEAVLAKWREGGIEGERPISARTSGFYGQACFSFCKWLVREGLLNENPLAGLSKARVLSERRRRALSGFEQAALIAAAERGPDWRGISGEARAMAYRAALATGFRLSELKALTVGDFDLTADVPTVTLSPEKTKNRKPCTQPLPRELARLLSPFLARRMPAAKALAMPRAFNGALMVRFDLAAARAAYLESAGSAAERAKREKDATLLSETEEGRADFHSLRHSFVSNLARAGVPVKTAMDLARHSDVNLTLRRYSHTVLGDRSAAVELAAAGAAAGAPAALATGTDGEAAPTAPDAGRLLAQFLAQSGATSDNSDTLKGNIGPVAGGAQVSAGKAHMQQQQGVTNKPPSGLEPETCGLQNPSGWTLTHCYYGTYDGSLEAVGAASGATQNHQTATRTASVDCGASEASTPGDALADAAAHDAAAHDVAALAGIDWATLPIDTLRLLRSILQVAGVLDAVAARGAGHGQAERAG